MVENVVDSTRFDGIDTNRFPFCRFVIPEIDLRGATPCESRRNLRIESNRKVPQVNGLSLGVLDMDDLCP